MLALVIVTSNLGNTYFEATTPASVTVIMSQFGGLTISIYCAIVPNIHSDNHHQRKVGG